MATLPPIEFFNGIVAIIINVFFFYIGISILRNYYKYKDKRLLYTGIAIFFMSFPWLPISISFISFLIVSQALPFEIYYILGYGFTFGIFFWLLAFTDMTYKSKKKIIIGIYSVYLIILIILFYVLLFTNQPLIGSISGTIMASHGLFLRIRNLIRLVILLLTGFLIWYKSKDSPSAEVRFKAKMILLGVILFAVGGVFFSITNISVLPLIFFIPSLFGVYAGFALPDWMKRFITKEE
ncbi:MAG: hypothetical protein ACQERB_11675 [Promethearchaeati archaeon]